jgi:hypothetical protein
VPGKSGIKVGMPWAQRIFLGKMEMILATDLGGALI